MEERDKKNTLVKCGNEYLTQQYLDEYDRELEEGNAQVERGEFVTHEEMMRITEGWIQEKLLRLHGRL
ncbi:MAG: hypothetical protein ACO1NW_18770 [Chitinophagaceae bacterium]